MKNLNLKYCIKRFCGVCESMLSAILGPAVFASELLASKAAVGFILGLGLVQGLE